MAGLTADGQLSTAPASTRGCELSFARHEDDEGLRALLRRSVLPGALRVAFTREPQYFAGEGLAGGEDFTVVARRDGAVVGMGRCTLHTLHRNGQVQRVGYLGELRVIPGTPSSARLLRDGFAALVEMASASTVDGFVTAITADNHHARRVLERGRRLGLPSYRALSPLVTLVAPVTRTIDTRARTPTAEHGVVSDIDSAMPDELTDFLETQARETQLSLQWNAVRWDTLARHSVTAADFLVVRRGGRITAAAAVWDQRDFRQTVIDGYGGAMRLGRPWVNVLQRMRGLPTLPGPGQSLALGALLGVTVPHSGDWPELWHALQARAAAVGLDWLTLTRDARDPQNRSLRRLLRAREYHTTLYDVTWPNHSTWDDAWDGRLFAPEVGLL